MYVCVCNCYCMCAHVWKNGFAKYRSFKKSINQSCRCRTLHGERPESHIINHFSIGELLDCYNYMFAVDSYVYSY